MVGRVAQTGHRPPDRAAPLAGLDAAPNPEGSQGRAQARSPQPAFDPDPIYTPTAGLVLLGAYVQRAFATLQLTANSKFIDEAARILNEGGFPTSPLLGTVVGLDEIDRAMALTNLNDHEVTLFAALARKLRIDGGGILQLDACDVDANRFGNNVASRITEWPWEGWSMDSRHGADLHCLAVAGASILAKVARDNALQSLSAETGIELGSGYPSDPTTIAAIPQLIEGVEPHDCLRWGWATVRDAWQAAHNAQPPQRPVDPNAPPNAQRTLF